MQSNSVVDSMQNVGTHLVGNIYSTASRAYRCRFALHHIDRLHSKLSFTNGNWQTKICCRLFVHDQLRIFIAIIYPLCTFCILFCFFPKIQIIIIIYVCVVLQQYTQNTGHTHTHLLAMNVNSVLYAYL